MVQPPPPLEGPAALTCWRPVEGRRHCSGGIDDADAGPCTAAAAPPGEGRSTIRCRCQGHGRVIEEIETADRAAIDSCRR